MPFTKGRYHSSSPVRKIPKISKGNSQKLMIVSARPVLSKNGLIGVWRVEKIMKQNVNQKIIQEEILIKLILQSMLHIFITS